MIHWLATILSNFVLDAHMNFVQSSLASLLNKSKYRNHTEQIKLFQFVQNEFQFFKQIYKSLFTKPSIIKTFFFRDYFRGRFQNTVHAEIIHCFLTMEKSEERSRQGQGSLILSFLPHSP